MTNAKHQLVNYDQNSNFDNSADPVTKTPFSIGESVVVCRDKNSLISTRSLEANEHLCPFCNRLLDSNLTIIGVAKNNVEKKTTTPYSPPAQPQQRATNTSPLLWAGLAIVALVCLVLAATGVFGALGALGSSNPPPIYYEQPTSIPAQPTAPRSTNTPRSTSTTRPKPTSTPASQNLKKAEVSDEIYFVALRKSPGYVGKNDQTDVIVEVPSGSIVTLLGDSKKADGITWWYVNWNGYKGWMAERTGSGKTILIFK